MTARRVGLQAASRAEEAGLVALLDLAAAVDDWDHYRVIGGHMVGIHLALAGLSRHRGTKEADLAAPTNVIGDPSGAPHRLVSSSSYAKLDGGRIVRDSEYGTSAIDLIGPSATSGKRHNREAGMFSVDEFPGIRFCLLRQPVLVTGSARSMQEEPMGEALLAVPDVAAAIVLKACSDRPSDLEDAWLLVDAAEMQGAVLTEADCENLDAYRAAQQLHHRWADRQNQQRRLSLNRVVWRPPAPAAFQDP